jgi:hypothetical protein
MIHPFVIYYKISSISIFDGIYFTDNINYFGHPNTKKTKQNLFSQLSTYKMIQ